MLEKKLSRGARACANHGSETFSATERSENTPPIPTIQAQFVSRRFGIALIRAALIARLAFSQDGGRA